jgi:glycosyltransferase involved in cell wall biosynthesis
MRQLKNMNQPLVSIILPTYNRARFLRAALDSINSQTFQDWELIVVDDGSTDDSREVIPGLLRGVRRPTRYILQANQGPYGARNTGLDHAGGKYVAFFDSDDVWLPHHLQDCLDALRANPEVGWVYGSCRMVDNASGEILAPNTFYDAGKQRPFLKLNHRQAGRVRIINDTNAVSCAILHGLCCGLQNSVIDRRLFAQYRFTAHDRNEAEDQVVVVRALCAGYRLAYLDNVHVVYTVHEGNSSGSAKNGSLQKNIIIREKLIAGFQEMRRQLKLTWSQNQTLNRRLAYEYFWKLGYGLLWQNGRRSEALRMFRRGLALWPWDPYFWKTYLLALGRTFLSAGN